MIEKNTKGKRISGTHFPTRTLNDALNVAKSVYENGGKSLDVQSLAVAMKHTTTSSSFHLKVSSAIHFGLLTREKDIFHITEISKAIFNPLSKNDEIDSLQKAFFNFEVFRELFEKYEGKSLPEKSVLESIFVREYGISPSSKEIACKVFLESAKTAKLIADDEKTILSNEQSRAVDSIGEEKQNSDKINLINQTIASLIKDIGSLKIMSEFWNKLKDDEMKDYEKRTTDLLENALKCATEMQLSSTKLALKIMKDRLSNEGHKSMINYFPYVEEAYQEDLNLPDPKKEEGITDSEKRDE